MTRPDRRSFSSYEGVRRLFNLSIPRGRRFGGNLGVGWDDVEAETDPPLSSSPFNPIVVVVALHKSASCRDEMHKCASHTGLSVCLPVCLSVLLC